MLFLPECYHLRRTLYLLSDRVPDRNRAASLFFFFLDKLTLLFMENGIICISGYEYDDCYLIH